MHTIKRLCATIALACAFQCPVLATELLSPRDLSLFPTTANSGSGGPASSTDGRYVAFASSSNDIVAGDTNRRADVFVYDRASGTMQRVSVSTAGAQANSDSFDPSISADGRLVAFTSMASNLVANDTNGGLDVFVHDRQTHTTTRVSVSTSGAQASAGATPADSSSPSISADGRYVAFLSNATNFVSGAATAINRVYLRDRQASTTNAVSVSSGGTLANQSSSEPTISADGNIVAFASGATNLVANDTNGVLDVFVRNRAAATTSRVSVDSSGAQANGSSLSPALSADGRYVVFTSSATNLVAGVPDPQLEIYLRDRQTNTTTFVSTLPSGFNDIGDAGEPSISADGNIIAYRALTADDFPPVWQIFIANRQTGGVRQVTFGPSTASADFSGSTQPTVSGNGRYVFFSSSAYNLVDGDGNDANDVFAFDNAASTISLVSISKVFSRTGTGASTGPSLSADGRFAAFTSTSAVLVPGDSNGGDDVFVNDRATHAITRASISSAGVQGDDFSRDALISADGKSIVFDSWANTLVLDDTFGVRDVFVHNRESRVTTRESVDANGIGGFQDSFAGPLSADGRFVLFSSLADNLVPNDPIFEDAFVRDRRTGVLSLVSKSSSGQHANDHSNASSITADGRFVVFESIATNLVPGDTNGQSDVFLHDRQTCITRRVSVGPGGVQANGISGGGLISGNGRYVAFSSSASNLASNAPSGGLFIRDLQTSTNILVTTTAASPSYISPDGRFLAFSSTEALLPGDTNNVSDVFVYDHLTGFITQETQGNDASVSPSLSANGRIITFASRASDFVADDNNDNYDIFSNERNVAQVIRINVAGAGFTDSQSRFWEADRGFNTGSASTFASPIANTVDDVLYQTERWDPNTTPELQYSFAVPNGTYLVRLHFAENDAKNFGAGRRVFDVDIEGVQRFDNIDVFAEAGARTALIKSTLVAVSDGRIDILFRHQTQNPIVDAIEIIGQ
jgi:Tol biopolymer transport system component